MSPNWENLIETVCPTLYPKSKYHYGFACSDGWVNLIVQCSLKLEALAFNQNNPKVYVAQLKEKFAMLNMYLTNGTPEMQEIVNHYESLSNSTCEDCGSTDKTVNNKGKTNWMRTLCKECRIAYEASRA